LLMALWRHPESATGFSPAWRVMLAGSGDGACLQGARCFPAPLPAAHRCKQQGVLAHPGGLILLPLRHRWSCRQPTSPTSTGWMDDVQMVGGELPDHDCDSPRCSCPHPLQHGGLIARALLLQCVNRWLQLRLELIGQSITMLVALLVVLLRWPRDPGAVHACSRQ
jgi:hypothetical protein